MLVGALAVVAAAVAVAIGAHSSSPEPDSTAPVVTSSLAGPRGDGGWYVGDVTVAWTVVEEQSPETLSTVGCAPLTFTVTQDQAGAPTYECTAVSDGGTTRETLTVWRDGTPPSRAVGVAERAPDRNGWYDAPVTVRYSGEDATSGVRRCSTPTYDSGDGRSVTVFGSCTDEAGNTTRTPTSFNYDATAPTVTPTVSPDPVVLGGPISVRPGARDTVAHVATSRCGPVTTAVPGARAVTCSATDYAGNRRRATVGYVVQYAVSTPLPLLRRTRWRVGSTVEMRVRVTDATGQPIPDREATALGDRMRFSVTGVQGTSAPMTYDAATDRFRHAWRVGRTTGTATVSVAVTYPGTTVTTMRSASVTVTR